MTVRAPTIKTSSDSDELAYSFVDEYGMKQGEEEDRAGRPSCRLQLCISQDSWDCTGKRRVRSVYKPYFFYQ